MVDSLERFYARQICLPEVGMDGQKSIANAHILMVGAGGLGCPVLLYLASSGIGKITIIDPDIVEETNLHRQILYTHDHIGQYKAEIACDVLKKHNPSGDFTAITDYIGTNLAERLIPTCDVVIDGTDRFLTKYMLSSLCLRYKKPFIAGAALGLAGYIGGFCGDSTAGYQAIFPDIPDTITSCATNGILPPVVGLIGMMQATSTLRIIIKSDPSPLGEFHRYEAKKGRFSSFSFSDSLVKQENFPDITYLTDYNARDFYCIDVREEEELCQMPLRENHISMPLSRLRYEEIVQNYKDFPILIRCHSGRRAEQVAVKLALRFDIKEISIGI